MTTVLILIEVNIFIASILAIILYVKKLARAGNNYVLVVNEPTIKDKHKEQYRKITTPYIQLYILIILGIIATNGLFIHAIINPTVYFK